MERIVKWVWDQGIQEIVVCPGRRNALLVEAFAAEKSFKLWPWFEERSGAFFALGRARATGRPVAVLTTSGTAVGELLPAAMESYYAGGQLLLLTADRPRRFRGTGAPQTAEQVDIFSCYAKTIDREEGDSLEGISMKGVSLHLNIALEEPKDMPSFQPLVLEKKGIARQTFSKSQELIDFLQPLQHPLVIVSTLAPEERASVKQFLLQLKAPVYLEGISGLREEPLLEPYRIKEADDIFSRGASCHYPIDGVLRLGGVPTLRAWRQLKVKVLSIYHRPFSGTPDGAHITSTLSGIERVSFKGDYNFSAWKEFDEESSLELQTLLDEEPESEPALIRALSQTIPLASRVYIGNSLPIREWDLAASYSGPSDLWSSRGLNGIDGQIAQFLGIGEEGRENWGIIGDLGTLYDMAAFSIAPKLTMPLKLVVVNNGGGMIFSRFGYGDLFLHRHTLHFEPLAKLWGWDYHLFDRKVGKAEGERSLIELVPCPEATKRFWSKKDARTARLSRKAY